MFQLWSHANLYEDDHPGNFISTPYDRLEGGQTRTEAMKERAMVKLHIHSKHRDQSTERHSVESSTRRRPMNGEATTAESSYPSHMEVPDSDTEKQKPPKDDDVEEPKMSLYMSIGLLAVVTVVSVSTRCKWIINHLTDFLACW